MLEKVSQDVAGAAGGGMENLNVWLRSDHDSLCLRGSRKYGPEEKHVVARRTYCAKTGLLLLAEEMLEVPRRLRGSHFSRGVFTRPRDIVTVLLFQCPEVRAQL